jgi:hypothetical protein
MNWILFIQSKENIPNAFLYYAIKKPPELILGAGINNFKKHCENIYS